MGVAGFAASIPEPRVVKILSRTFRPVKQAVWDPTNWQILNRIDPTTFDTGLRRRTIGALASVPNGEFSLSQSGVQEFLGARTTFQSSWFSGIVTRLF
jgi:hypothetical protein